MNPKNYPHLIIPYPPALEPFTSARGGGVKESRSFSGDRARHGERLLNQYNNAIPVSEQTDTRGMIISFQSFPGLELAFSIEPFSPGFVSGIAPEGDDDEGGGHDRGDGGGARGRLVAGP